MTLEAGGHDAFDAHNESQRTDSAMRMDWVWAERAGSGVQRN